MRLTHNDQGEPRIDLSDEDPDRLMAELKGLVEANPDFVYDRPVTQGKPTGCVYARDNAPSCLIGQWLYKLGVPVADLTALDRIAELGLRLDEDDPESSDLTDTGIFELLEFEIITLPEGFAPEVITNAQVQQDQGVRWGLVLDPTE